MPSLDRISAKAKEVEDRSDAIVVSFDAKWYAPIRARTLSLVIRKRIPTSCQPKWLYFHVNSPKSAICARARLTSIAYMPTELVRTFSSELALSSREIDEYCTDLEKVGAYRIEGIELASTDISTRELQRKLIYVPPQSFMFLSKEGKAVIDVFCNFTDMSMVQRVRAR